MRSLRNWSPAGCKELQIMAECSTRKSDVISSLYALIFKSNKKQKPIPSFHLHQNIFDPSPFKRNQTKSSMTVVLRLYPGRVKILSVLLRFELKAKAFFKPRQNDSKFLLEYSSIMTILIQVTLKLGVCSSQMSM